MPSVRELHNNFGAEIIGIDVKDRFSDESTFFIRRALDEYGVILIRNFHLSKEDQIAFSGKLGPIHPHVTPGLPTGMMYVTNINKDGEIITGDDSLFWKNIGSQLWHTDGPFFAISPKYSIMSAQVIPSKDGNTEYSFMPAAYDRLDKETKDLVEDLVAEHSTFYLWTRIGFGNFTPEQLKTLTPVRQKFILKNDYTGRKSLYLSSTIGKIVGWSMPESRYFVDNLIALATQRDNVYSHEWEVDDLIIWDNRQCMHRATPLARLDEPRVFHRTTVLGTELTTAQDSDRINTPWYEPAEGVMSLADIGIREKD